MISAALFKRERGSTSRWTHEGEERRRT